MINLIPPRMARGAVLAIAAAMVALLALAPAALAARDPLASGNTDFHMKRGFLRKLGNLEVTLAGIGGGNVIDNKVGLTVMGGKLDPTNVKGYVEANGGFKFMRGARGVPVTGVTVNTVKAAVYADVAKTHMKLGELSTLTSAREGFGSNFKTAQMRLTAQAARRISNRLGVPANRQIKGGRVMSNAYVAAQPSTVTVLPQGKATLTGDTGTLAKFGAKGVELPDGISALAPATKPTPTSFQFPITGGTLAPDGTDGVVDTAGTVQILKKAEPFSPQMKMANIQVDFKAKTATVEIELLPNPPFPGAVGRSSIVDIVLPAKSVTSNPAARTITVAGVEARLQAVAASTLNNVFNQPAPEPPPSSNFVVGDSLGTFSMTVQAQ
jgi:hypothetical protein